MTVTVSCGVGLLPGVEEEGFFGAVVVEAAVDVGSVYEGAVVEGRAGEEEEIGVFAGLEGAEAGFHDLWPGSWTVRKPDRELYSKTTP